MSQVFFIDRFRIINHNQRNNRYRAEHSFGSASIDNSLRMLCLLIHRSAIFEKIFALSLSTKEEISGAGVRIISDKFPLPTAFVN